VTAEVGFNCLTDASSDFLDAVEVSCLVFSCCPAWHGYQHYFFLFANPMQKPQKLHKSQLTQITSDIFRWIPPVILIALGHVVWCWLHSQNQESQRIVQQAHFWIL